MFNLFQNYIFKSILFKKKIASLLNPSFLIKFVYVSEHREYKQEYKQIHSTLFEIVLTRIAFRDDYFRSYSDVVTVTMHQQRSRDSKRSLLLLVQQYRPSTSTFDPDHPWQ